MKLADIEKANKLSFDLKKFSEQREGVIQSRSVTVNFGGTVMQLGDHEEPSKIGQAFRATKRATLVMLDDQIEDCRKTLGGLGVQP